MPDQGILQVGEVGVEDLYEQIPNFEQGRESSEGNFIQDELVVKIAIRFAVDQSHQLQPPPTSLENIHQVESVPHYRPPQHIDEKEDEEYLHLLLVPLVLEVLALPLGGLGDEPPQGGVDDAEHGGQHEGGDIDDVLALRQDHYHQPEQDQQDGEDIHRDELYLLHLLRCADAHPPYVVGLLRPISRHLDVTHIVEVVVHRTLEFRDLRRGLVDAPRAGELTDETGRCIDILKGDQVAIQGDHVLLAHLRCLRYLLLDVLFGIVFDLLEEPPHGVEVVNTDVLHYLVDLILVLQLDLPRVVLKLNAGQYCILYLDLLYQSGLHLYRIDSFTLP